MHTHIYMFVLKNNFASFYVKYLASARHIKQTNLDGRLELLIQGV
jgi:hypothetical protein